MFCEECGSPLEPGVRFCENCGTPVPQDEVIENTNRTSDFSLFQFNTIDWEGSYSQFSNGISGEKAIIVTSLNRLCSQLNCSCEVLLCEITKYAEFCADNGIVYSLLDMDNQKVVSSNSCSIENVINALSKICAVDKPKYVFILGNENVIQVAEWKNESGDSDATVTSDLAYQTLNLTSPWDGHNYVFNEVLRVGRLPSYNGESLDKFTSYFTNAMNSKMSFSNLQAYGLSAKVWKNESDYEFKNLSPSVTDSSPIVSKDTVEGRISHDANLLLFNLHGSEQTKYWYGQEGDSYPEAFEPKCIDTIRKPFFLGVEACYGARYIGNLNEQESIVVKAMQSGCIGLLGSSKIAYGTSNPPGSCADFVIGEFLKQIKNGVAAGDAHVLGIQRLCRETKDIDDAEIKTIAEFSLYGDPSQRTMYGSGGAKSIFGKAFGRSIHVDVPDIRAAVKMNLAQIDEKINTLINEHVYQKFAYMRGTEPKTYKMEGKDLYQSIYQKQDLTFNRIVKVYFDKNGKIKKELESK